MDLFFIAIIFAPVIIGILLSLKDKEVPVMPKPACDSSKCPVCSSDKYPDAMRCHKCGLFFMFAKPDQFCR
jgi:rubredoxin